MESSLTFSCHNGIMSGHGEMSERFKELVLKTSDAATHRGFESHSLRQSFYCHFDLGVVPKRPKGLPC